jgi:predicted RNase H-like HicB family nuclease
MPDDEFLIDKDSHVRRIILNYGGKEEMLVKYINKAMSQAVYDKLEDSSFCGKIPDCPGVIAFADSLYHCQEELQSVLEGWIIVKLRHGDKLPVIGKMNLNKGTRSPKKAVTHA